MSDHSDLRKKIDEAKRLLPLPDSMAKEGLGDHAKKSARCPFPGHEDNHPSFSVFQGADGFWHYKCFTGCGEGDEIMFLRKVRGLSLNDAMNLYLSMANFPSRAPRKSPECPQSPRSPETRKSHGCPKSPVFPVSPVSNGQVPDAEKQRLLELFGERNACTRTSDNADRKRFKLARDVRAVEIGIGRQLSIDELMIAFEKWHRLSKTFLDPAKTRDDHWIAFLAELEKVRMPFGEGTLAKALDNVSKLSLDELPVIPGYANPPEKCRRLIALHRELSRLSANGTYFLSYRDAAKAFEGLSPQEAHTITGALVRYGVIKILSKGEAGLNGAKAAVFQCLLPETESADEDDDEIAV
jgi:CHC2 zinc finger